MSETSDGIMMSYLSVLKSNSVDIVDVLLGKKEKEKFTCYSF